MVSNLGEAYPIFNNGIAYLDGSGIFGGGDFSNGFVVSEHKKRIKLLSIFTSIIRERSGGVLTVFPVLDEIKNNIMFYRDLAKKMIRYRKNRTKKNRTKKFTKYYGSSYDKSRSDSMINVAKKGCKEYSKLCNILENGIIIYGLEERDSEFAQISDFFEYYNNRKLDLEDKLSDPDKVFVTEALCAGDDVGIIAGDKGVNFTYYQGVRNFNLGGCFICDSRQGRSYNV
jgi:hypothetical protein